MTKPDLHVLPATQPTSFEDFWKLYPRKEGKLKARLAFQAIVNGGKRVKVEGEPVILESSPARLLEALRAYLRTITSRGEIIEEKKDFIPHASTWLNSGRFLDYED